jgi:hypothetical protein
LIAWFGMDRHGRSAIVNTDGAVMLNIGDYIKDAAGNQKFNPGSLAVRVNLADDQNSRVGELQPGVPGNNKTEGYPASDIVLYFGPQGIVVASGSGTPIAIRSSGDILLEAAGTLDMKAKEIRVDAGYLRRIKNSKGDI